MLTTAIFPSRYVQGADALDALGAELALLGRKALVIEDPFVYEHLQSRLSASMHDKLGSVTQVFGGECCDEEIERLQALGRSEQVDVIVGIGGGKTLDTAKAVGVALGARVAIVPTLASTDAPCSALAVVYTRDGAFKRYLITPRNPDLVLVDTQVVARAPVRLLVSGMGDALSTWFEAEDCRITSAGNMTGRPGPMSAYGLARLCYDTLIEYGLLAKTACEQQVVTPALERVVEANTLLSGLGFESGGLSAAHAIHNGLTALEATHGFWHGEKVAFGTLSLLMLTDRAPALIDTVYGFCESVGLPTTLAQIGLGDVTDTQLMAVAELACASGETIHNEPFVVTPKKVFAALRAADAEGRRRAASAS
jgi:glycerol dehydrogenase